MDIESKERETDPYSNKRKARGWRKLEWSVKGPIFVLVGLIGFFGHSTHWGRLAVAAGLALSYPIFAYRDFWNEPKFWTTVILLSALQALAVLTMRHIAEVQLPLVVAVGISDCALMVAAISWLFSEKS